MAETLSGMPIERAFVVHGEPGWDEASPVGEFVLYDVRPESVTMSHRVPEDYGLRRCRAEDLAGGDAQRNAHELRRVFCREETGAHRGALLMGTSLVLEVTGLARNGVEGAAMAAEVLDSGRAEAFLDRFQAHFA
jgi:anthranilate phosphoribosyltransferase